MPSKIELYCDFNGFGEGKWGQLGARIEEKLDVNVEKRCLTIRALPAVRARILKIRASKLGVNIEQKTKKR